MLLTDGNPNTTEDLRDYESAILTVAYTESIDLNVKLRLALEDVTFDILDFLLSRSGGFSPGADPKTTVRRAIGVSDVVVTRQLKRWQALHTLEMFYRDAFHNQLNDRYQSKFREYRELTNQAKSITLQFGIGLVRNPLPTAPLPMLSFEAASVEAATYFVRASWINSDGQEGAPSMTTSYDALAGSVPVVGLSDPPLGAVGFNVYLGLTPDSVTRQNSDVILVDQTFTMPASGLVAGALPGQGQEPDLYITNATMLRRG